MSNLWEQWDPDNADNNNAAPPNGAPENATNISDLNNIQRTLMQSDAQLGRDLTAAINGLGTMASQNSDAVAITGGTITGTTITGGTIGDASTPVTASTVTATTVNATTLTGNGSALTEVNAAKLHGYTYDELMPIGAVIMWFGLPANRPPGWELCDGLEGRPKLTGRMPFGVDVNHNLGTEAGQVFDSINGYDRNTALGGDHNHGGATQPHTLTNAEMPQHIHAVTGGGVSGAGTLESGGEFGPSDINTGPAGGNQPHAHDISASGDHQHSYNVNPPRLAIYFLIKVANVSAP